MLKESDIKVSFNLKSKATKKSSLRSRKNKMSNNNNSYFEENENIQ